MDPRPDHGRASQSNRSRFERELTDPGGIDAEEMYRLWGEARRACPFQKLQAGDEAAALLGSQRGSLEAPAGDFYIAWRHDDVAQIMGDVDHFEKPGPGGPFHNTILSMNGEEHRKHRNLVRDAFTPAAVARWEQTLIDPLMHRLLDSFAALGRADLVRDYTSHFPFHVIRTLLGFSDDDHDTFIGLAMPHAGTADDDLGFGDAWEHALYEFLAPRVEAARSREGDDLLSTLVHAEIDGRRLSDDELYRFLVLLIPAGADTTYAASGNLFLGLLGDPSQIDLVRANPRLAARAADEALRWQNSAAPSFLRVAVRDTHVAEVPVREGTVVAAHVSSHNRDERRYPDSDHFDITRPVIPRGVFGYGPHACLGMHLARAEMKSALRAVVDRLPNVRLDPEAPAPYVRFGVGFPSPATLPVVFDAR